MSELQWLDEYTGQTTAELVALEGQYRTDSIVCAFESAIQKKADAEGHASLTEEERVVLAVEAIEREVNNGGYSQFFFNVSDPHAPAAVAALNRIGCEEAAQLTQRAIDVLGIDGPLTAESIEAALDVDDEAQEDALGECDDAYYQFEEDLAGPLLAFIKSHQDQIRLGA